MVIYYSQGKDSTSDYNYAKIVTDLFKGNRLLLLLYNERCVQK